MLINTGVVWVPVDGFYEWRKEGEGKQLFRIGFKEGKPFVFAGLWESWTVPADQEDAGEMIETYTIVTDANERIAPDIIGCRSSSIRRTTKSGADRRSKRGSERDPRVSSV